jgi:hypothetical protein
VVLHKDLRKSVICLTGTIQDLLAEVPEVTFLTEFAGEHPHGDLRHAQILSLAGAAFFHYIGGAMLKKALIPILLILAAAVVLAAIEYGCMKTGLEEKVLGPEQHHH